MGRTDRQTDRQVRDRCCTLTVMVVTSAISYFNANTTLQRTAVGDLLTYLIRHVINVYEMLRQHVVNASSVNSFKDTLDKYWKGGLYTLLGPLVILQAQLIVQCD